MGRRGPPGLSLAERADMWCRWKAGYHVREIARAFGRDHGSIRSLLAQRGGIVPSVRTRASLALTLIEREDISRGIASGESGRSIADRIGRAASTVSREISRHGGRGAYRANNADSVAWESGLRPKSCLLALNGKLRNIVASKLALDWSPEQVAGWLNFQYPDDESMRVSHETIYRSLFIQARGVLKRELIGHLRSRRTMRHSRKAGTHGESRGQIPDAVSIRDRPAEIEDRAVPGLGKAI
jgi:IS30 family transposase